MVFPVCEVGSALTVYSHNTRDDGDENDSRDEAEIVLPWAIVELGNKRLEEKDGAEEGAKEGSKEANDRDGDGHTEFAFPPWEEDIGVGCFISVEVVLIRGAGELDSPELDSCNPVSSPADREGAFSDTPDFDSSDRPDTKCKRVEGVVRGLEDPCDETEY